MRANFERRKFLRFISLAIASMAITRRAVAYECKFTRDLGEISFAQFNLERIEYEDDRRVTRLNSDFKARGKLLDIVHLQKGQSLTWIYRFRSAADFKEWEQNLYSNGMINDHALRELGHHQVKRTFRYVPWAPFA